MKSFQNVWRHGLCLLATFVFALCTWTQAQDTYTKITTEGDLTDGEYLIVYDGGNKALTQGNEAVSVEISNGAITTEVATVYTKTDKPHKISITKTSDGKYTLQNLLNEGSSYLTDDNPSATKASKFIYGSGSSSASKWTITFATSGACQIKGGSRYIKYGTSTSSDPFRLYQSGQGDIFLYKKGKKASCGKVSNVNVELNGADGVKLSWTVPETAPEKYKVSIKKGETVVVDAEAVTAIEYTKTGLDAGTDYTYSIVSVCAEGSESAAVEGTFTTKSKICPQAANVSAVANTEFTLTWAEPTEEAEKATTVELVPLSYDIFISTAADKTTAVKEQNIAAGTKTYTCNDLAAGEYTYKITSNCADSKTSTPVSDDFTITAANAKSLNVNLEGTQDNGKYTGAITFKFTTANFTLGTDGKVKIEVLGNKHNKLDTVTDQAELTLHLKSDEYIATFSLVSGDDNAALTPDAVEVLKEFTVKWPDVANPVFTPDAQAAEYNTEQSVTIACATEGATIWYSLNNAAYAAYTQAIALNEDGTYVFKAFAVKAGMDTSALITKTYKLKLPLRIEGIAVFESNFNKEVDTKLWNKTGSFTAPDKNMTRFGSGSQGASITTKNELDLLQDFTVYLKAQAFSSTENKCKVTVTVGNNSQTKDVIDMPSDKTGEYALNFSFASAAKAAAQTVKAKITVATYENKGDNRFYLKDVKVYQATATPVYCAAVTNVNTDVKPDTVTMTWDTTDFAPAKGYRIEIRKKSDNSLVCKDTVKNPKVLSYKRGALGEQIEYTYTIMSLCSETSTSDEVSGEFATTKAGAPAMVITAPTNGQTIADKEVNFAYTVTDFVLGTGEDANGFVKYTITSNRLAAPITDTCTALSFKRTFEKSGNYTVVFELVDKDKNVLTPEVKRTRNFIVDLPDVASPVFAPEAGTFDKDTAVRLSCATEGATIHYAIGNAAFAPYTQAIALNENGTYTIRAFAVKQYMDTSATVTKTYTINKPAALEGEIVFEEYFDKLSASVSETTNISAEINKYTSTPGWVAVNVYPANAGGVVKVGSSKAAGRLSTPAIDLSANNGKFVVSFYAQAWYNDTAAFALGCGDETIVVNGLDNTKQTDKVAPTGLRHFAFVFNNGTASSKIVFQSVKEGKNRFFLDSIRIYQVVPQIPTLSVPVSPIILFTTANTPETQEITIKGKMLEGDVTVACPQGNFSVDKTTLPKTEVMSKDGCKLAITYNGAKDIDSTLITLTSGTLTKTIKVKGAAEGVTEVADLEALLNGTKGQIYKVTGKVVLSAKDKNNASQYMWVQDDKAGIMIYDRTGLVTTTYNVGDGITGIIGKLGEYSGQKQLEVVGNLPAASSTANAIEPIELSVIDLNADMDKYCARLVKVKGLTLKPLAATGNWEANKDNYAVDADENELNIRTFVRTGDYIGEAKPQGEFDLVAIVGIYNGNVQVSPRSKADITTIGGGEDPDECNAPTNLRANVATNKLEAVLSWNGEVSKYRLVLVQGNDTLYNQELSAKTHTFTTLLKQKTTYNWAVASVCDNNELKWTRGTAFSTPELVGNEDALALHADIHPNPTNGILFVELTEDARMDIYTLAGKLVRSAELAAGKTELNLTQGGIYFLRLSNAHGSVVRRVVVR